MPASLVVPLSDLEHGPKAITFSLSVAWLTRMLEEGGASPRGPGSVTLELTKHGPEVMVRGHADFQVTLPCVVTLDPVAFDLRSEIFLLLRQGKGAEAQRGAAGKTGRRGEMPAAKRRGRRRGDDSDLELSDQEAARDTFEGDVIVLDDFVREFLLLELPLYPRRPDLPSAPEGIVSRPLAGETGERSIDPRLEPLARLAERLRSAGNKE